MAQAVDLYFEKTAMQFSWLNKISKLLPCERIGQYKKKGE